MISRVITRVTILITLIRGLITPCITTAEPPSTDEAVSARTRLEGPTKLPSTAWNIALDTCVENGELEKA